MIFSHNNRCLYATALAAVLAVTIGPYLILGEHSYFLIHDHLDVLVPWAKVVADTGMTFSRADTVVEPFMGGVPRATFPSPVDLYMMLFSIWPPLYALMVNEFVLRVVAFSGMALLAEMHLLRGDAERVSVAALVASAFALLAHWQPGGFSVAGQPLLLWAFLNVRAGQWTWRETAVAVGYGLFSWLMFAGIFVIVTLAAIWCVDLFRKGVRPNWRTGLWGALLVVASLLREFQLVEMVAVGEKFVSHRVEFDTGVSWAQGFEKAWQVFSKGHYHAASEHNAVILPVTLIGLILAFAAPRIGRYVPAETAWALVGLLAFIILGSLWYGIEATVAVRQVWGNLHLPFVNLGRIIWLFPLVWHILFALALHTIFRVAPFRPEISLLMVIAVGLIQCVYTARMTDFQVERRSGAPSLAEFTSTPLFDEIDAYITRQTGLTRSQYRVASVGLHPAVSQMAGFWTVDGYHSNYPLAYKHTFRAIIAPELAKDTALSNYFDHWGNRVYIFSSELQKKCGQMCVKTLAQHAINLGFNAAAFRKLGGRYLFSAVEIANAGDVGLVFRGVFERDGAAWRIHLYEAVR